MVGNAVFAAAPLSLATGVQEADNVTDSVANAGSYVVSASLDLTALDLYPLVGQLTGAAVDTALLSADVDFDRDFNGTTKDFTYRGAYQGGEASNPGWDLAESIKDETTTSPGPDAGPAPDGGDPGVDGGPSADGGGGAADAGPGSSDSGGCGCRAEPGPAGWCLGLWMMLMSGWRWRRRWTRR